MGENLVLSMASRGFKVEVYNRTKSQEDDFIRNHAANEIFLGGNSLRELANSLEKTRKVMLLVKAGAAFDQLIEKLLPRLEEDIIIDGGNSHFPDTIHKTEYVENKGLLYWYRGIRRRGESSERSQLDVSRLLCGMASYKANIKYAAARCGKDL